MSSAYRDNNDDYHNDDDNDNNNDDDDDDNVALTDTITEPAVCGGRGQVKLVLFVVLVLVLIKVMKTVVRGVTLKIETVVVVLLSFRVLELSIA